MTRKVKARRTRATKLKKLRTRYAKLRRLRTRKGGMWGKKNEQKSAENNLKDFNRYWSWRIDPETKQKYVYDKYTYWPGLTNLPYMKPIKNGLGFEKFADAEGEDGFADAEGLSEEEENKDQEKEIALLYQNLAPEARAQKLKKVQNELSNMKEFNRDEAKTNTPNSWWYDKLYPKNEQFIKDKENQHQTIKEAKLLEQTELVDRLDEQTTMDQARKEIKKRVYDRMNKMDAQQKAEEDLHNAKDEYVNARGIAADDEKDFSNVIKGNTSVTKYFRKNVFGV